MIICALIQILLFRDQSQYHGDEQVLSVAVVFDLLAKRIAALRSQGFSPSTIYGEQAYDESQMMESDIVERIQRAELDYDC